MHVQFGADSYIKFNLHPRKIIYPYMLHFNICYFDRVNRMYIPEIQIQSVLLFLDHVSNSIT